MSTDLASSCKFKVQGVNYICGFNEWNVQNAYEKTKVSDEIFPTLLDYMHSIKGGMRQMALDIASKKLKPSEDVDKASSAQLDGM